MKPSGVGVVFVPTLLPFLREAADALSVIEIEPQTVWRLSRENECVRYALNQGQVEEIAALPYRKLLHSVGMPVGGTHTPESAQVELVKRMAGVFECPWVSDHLSFNTFQDGERSTSAGFFLPPRQTTASVDLAAQNIRHLSL